MSPGDAKFPFGDSDEGFIHGYDSEEGFVGGLDSEDGELISGLETGEGFVGGLDSGDGEPISGLETGEGFMAGLDSEDLKQVEDSAQSSPPLPDMSSERIFPRRMQQETLPPKYPAFGQHQPGPHEPTLPPNYKKPATLPPGPAARQGQDTLPPKYPAVRSNQETLPPDYPAKPDKATRPPHYPEEATAGPGYGAAAADDAPTQAPGYDGAATQGYDGTATQAPLYDAQATRLPGYADIPDSASLFESSPDVAPTSDPRAAATHLEAGDAARTALDHEGLGPGIDRDAPTDVDRIPVLDPGGSSEVRSPLDVPVQPPAARDPFASTRGSSTVSGWVDPEVGYQPAMRRPGSRAGEQRGSQLEQKLMQTMELDPDEVTGRDAWDDLVLRALESHGETPIIMPDSDEGPIFGTDSDSLLGAIPMPSDAGPITTPEQAVVAIAGDPKASVAERKAARATAMDRLSGLWSGDALWILLSMAGFLLGPILVAVGWDYYGADRAGRVGHPWAEMLKPSGSMGLWFGICGSILFLLNLTYVLRRRFFFLAKWVSLRLWLNLHFVFGLTGGSMILIHSSLQATNWVARVSSAAIAVALFSGVFGRYVLSHVPRREEGETAHRTELAIYLAQLRGDLRRKLEPFPRLRKLALEALAASAPKTQRMSGGLGVIPALIMGDLRALTQWRRFSSKLRRALRQEAKGGDAELEQLIDETLEMVRLHGRLGARLSQYESVQDLMDSWRALHMILALIMVVTMVLHVVIVLTYGNVF